MVSEKSDDMQPAANLCVVPYTASAIQCYRITLGYTLIPTDISFHHVASSAALLSDPLQQPTLRKSSSAIDWSGAVIEATRKNSRPAYEWTPPGLGDKGSFSNLTSLQLQSLAHSHNHPAHTFAPPSNHPHEGGLVMSTTTDRSQQNMSSAMVAAPQQSFAQSLAGSSSTSSVPSAAQSAAATASAALDHSASVDKRPAQSGAFGGIFQRGFFSKPAMRSEEESYRYLMALDR